MTILMALCTALLGVASAGALSSVGVVTQTPSLLHPGVTVRMPWAHRSAITPGARLPLKRIRCSSGNQEKKQSSCMEMKPGQNPAVSLATSTDVIERENMYLAQNYSPLPIALARGQGAWVWDVEGRRLLDMMGAYSVVSQGHSHPRIVDALVRQARTLACCSRAVHSDQLEKLGRHITQRLGYDRVLMMNTGAEAFETAVKMARRWAYDVKGVTPDQAKIIVAAGNFHGRSMSAVSASTDPSSRGGFGPYLPGFVHVPFDDLGALERVVRDPNVAAFIVEPIQGEAGVRIPRDGYLRGARELCTAHNVLLVADEVQTGLGRTGHMLAIQHDNVRPDIVMLAKALSGGMMPISAVLADDPVMLCIKPGQHGSTFGGNPLAAAVALASLQVLDVDGLVKQSERMGKFFLAGLHSLRSQYVRNVRGRGLFAALDLEPRDDGRTAHDVVLALLDLGVLAKDTHKHTIRFAPPLIITENELRLCLGALQEALDQYGADPAI